MGHLKHEKPDGDWWNTSELTTDPNLFTNISFTTAENNETTRELPYPMALAILQKINYIIFPSLLTLGLTGNAIIVVVMMSKQYRHVTSRLYLIPLAISDSTLLILQVFNKKFVIDTIGYDVRALNNTCCKAFFVLFRTSKMVSSWFVVFLCLERFIAVWFPLKARDIITKKVIAVQVAIVILLIGSLNSVWSYASEISDSDKQCHPDSYDRNIPEERFMFMMFLTVAACLYSFIPSLILVVFTPLIIVQLVRFRRIRKTLTSKQVRRENENVRISVMLIGIMIAFVILVTPVIMLHIIANYKGMNAFGNNGTDFSVYLEIAQVLEQLNYSVNFCLYILTSSQFRKKFFELFKISSCTGVCLNMKTNKNRQMGTEILETADELSRKSDNDSFTLKEQFDNVVMDLRYENNDSALNVYI